MADADKPTPTFTKEERKAAMQAFKKRLKLKRLDEESGSSHGPMSGGKTSSICGITPPEKFPKEIWVELVKLGRLREGRYGTFELTSTPE